MDQGSILTECLSCGITREGIYLSCENCDGVPILRIRELKWRVAQNVPNIWRYSSMLPNFVRKISLGEGITPIRKAGDVRVKLETRNPTGSYADRSSAMISSYILSSEPGKAVRISYSRDFTYSLVSYLMGIADVEVILGDPEQVDPDEVLLLTELGANITFNVSGGYLSYANPLTIEGLKTITFELLERGFREGKVFVPAETGLLALSIWKGREDLRQAGVDSNIEVVAVQLEGGQQPEILKHIDDVRVVNVSREKALGEMIELAKAGIKTKLISAASLAALRERKERKSIAIITAASNRPKPLGARKSKLTDEIVEVLREIKEGTAYEVWERLGKYTLRGVYKSLVSLERLGMVASMYKMDGKRKKKIYFLLKNESA
ncbi:MAG: hypothetical protein QW039_02105 [Fervidicoccaceae archaeon]